LFDRKRKFLVAVIALVMSFILALMGILEGSQWPLTVAAIVGLYGGSEAAEGFGRKRQNEPYAGAKANG